MKYAGAVLALAGLALAVALFAREGFGSIVALLVAAGPGLVLAALFHVLPMIANGVAWGRLLSPEHRPGVVLLSYATWIRESVNGLLPVARIGGEIVAYRIVRRHVAGRSEAAASLVADMTLSISSQACFAVLGLALLFVVGHWSPANARLLAGLVVMLSLGAGFALAQSAGALGAVTRIVNRLLAGRLGTAFTQSLRFDRALRAAYSRRRDVVACFAWQMLGWSLGAGEIWLALYFLGRQRSVLDAVVIESLIQMVSSTAFIVPGALGVQEGAFVLIGAVLGIDATSALALATARRLRDVVIFFPGLCAWQWAETRIRRGRSASAPQSR